MSEQTKKPAPEAVPARRDFLKAMTGASVAAATAVVTTETAEAQALPRETRDERTKARYQPNAPDVQAYYRTNRY